MRNGCLLLAGWLSVFSATMAMAQQAPNATSPPRTTQIWLDPSRGKNDPIGLRDVAIDVRIQGFVASTTIDLTFFNPNTRVLEGELVFPLADGQTISGYALEVGGKLRQGVVVDKETARVAFESTVRRGVDPGLAELTRGNVFRTRLYPIPANGMKRVVLSFDQPLIDHDGDYRYVLPLAFDRKIHHFKVHAEAIRSEHAPKVALDSTALSFERARESYVADLERSDFQPTRELVFDLPKPTAGATVFAVDDSREPGWRTVAAQVRVPPLREEASSPIHRIALFYDASGSARNRDRRRELAFLQAWFARLGEVEVDFVAFRNDADPARHFSIRGGDSAKLRRAIEELSLDGGTSYGAIRVDPKSSPDRVVVIGDGLGTFGTQEPQLATTDGATPRLIVLHAAQSADSARLARLARRGGGEVLNLLELDDAAVLARVGAKPRLLMMVRALRGQCVDLMPSAPQPAGTSVTVSGRCRGPAELALRFSGAAADQDIGVRLDDTVLLDPDRGAFVTRLWATARVAELQNQPTPDTTKITDFAKRYGVVSANTSMLVLDRIEDYLRYRVEPREPELAAQYRALWAQAPPDRTDELERQAHRDLEREQWKEFSDYHQEHHPWLETLLTKAAEVEVRRWMALDGDKRNERNFHKAEALAERADALQTRWRGERDEPRSRKAWEDEARKLMLEVDGLRQARLALAPESDDPNFGRLQHIVYAPPALSPVAASPPPPARPEPSPLPPASAAVAPAGDAQPLEQMVVTGSRVRHIDIETASPALVIGKKEIAGGDAAPTALDAKIALQPWNPKAPYVDRLRKAKDPYAAYLAERETQATTPAFFVDCADYFRNEAKDARIAMRVLSNLAEIDLDSPPLLRVLAYRLQLWDRFDLAVPLFEQVLTLRDEEPQSRRDLALALSRQPQPDYHRAALLLWEIVDRRWDERFHDIETIALHELSDLIDRAPPVARAEIRHALAHQDADPDLLTPLPVDLRVVLSWDANDVDIDLWVIDPTGEVAIYSHSRTESGGHLSMDSTQGYGPEVFTIKRALPGTYVVKAHYFADHTQRVTGAVTAQVEFLTRFGNGESKRQATSRRLEEDKQEIEVGRFTLR